MHSTVVIKLFLEAGALAALCEAVYIRSLQYYLGRQQLVPLRWVFLAGDWKCVKSQDDT